MEKATFGAGCFWCIEAILLELKGVSSVKSGFSGGHIKNPSYREVCEGRTGHAEVAHIEFDSTQISYDELLEVFWNVHDPTTLSRQGNDVGEHYRSVVFYHTNEQQEKAAHYKKQLDASGAWGKPIVTEITAFEAFYPAEDYHDNYLNNNPDQPYCAVVVRPKVEKFKKAFATKLK